MRELHEKTLPGDEFYLHSGNHYWSIINSNGNYCGFCMATDIGHNMVFLSRAGVLKRYRGKGLHKRMIRIREAFAKRNGFKILITYTTKDNYSSFSHLIKEGYKIYEPEYAYAGPNVFYFIKEI